MYEVAFSVHGNPVGQGSMRHVGRGRLIHSPKLNAWREIVVAAVRDQAELTDMMHGAVRLSLTFTMPQPKTPKDLPTTRSSYDLDKLIRAIGDALTIGGLIEDDSRILNIRASKRYGETPGVLIQLGAIHD
jgi:crossover junction endodeoxyribonuclease RusA